MYTLKIKKADGEFQNVPLSDKSEVAALNTVAIYYAPGMTLGGELVDEKGNHVADISPTKQGRKQAQNEEIAELKAENSKLKAENSELKDAIEVFKAEAARMRDAHGQLIEETRKRFEGA